MQNASDNTIGGTVSGARNVVGANGFAFATVQDPNGTFTFKRHGIQVDGNHFSSANDPSENNVIKGNWLGLGTDGTTNLGNGEDGISIYRYANENIVGGPTDAEKNISVYNNEGIFIQLNSTGNVVQGNWVGLLPDGLTAVGNNNSGIKVQGESNQNIIGGSASGEGNIIVGHGSHGILSTSDLSGGQPPAEENLFYGNIIGDTTLANSNPTFANAGDGIHIQEQSQGNIIGGPLPGQGNIIGNNSGNAVFLLDATANRNRIVGNTMICNGARGIELNDAANNTATLGPIQINISDQDPNVIKGFAADYPRAVANGGPSVVHFYRIRTECGFDQCHENVEGYQLLDSVVVTSGSLPQGAGTGGVWEWDFVAEGFTTLSKDEITATVTDADGNTSEFASCITVCTDPGTVTFTSPETETCEGNSITLTATASGTPVPTGGFNYEFFRVGSPDVSVQSSTSNTYDADESGTYYVVVTDPGDASSCSVQSSNNITITINDLPNTSVITAGATEICEGTTGVTFSVTNTAGSTYNWTVPTGAVISTGQGTNSITVDFPVGAQSGNVMVVETTADGCTGASGQRTIAVTVNEAPNVSTITASATVICEQTSGVTFSVTNTAGSTYNWTVPTGAILVSGQGTNSITVDFPEGAQSGNVTVTETTSSGCTAATGQESIAVTVNQAPDISTITASATDICEQTTGVTFSVTNTPGSTYSWTVPTGAVIASGQGTNSITVDFPDGAQSGNVTVVETTAAGCTSTSTGEASIAVTVNQAPDISTITASDTEVCEGTTGVTFLVTNTTGSTYSWSVPTGAVIASGQGTNSITVDFPVGAQSGNVTVVETTAAGCTSTSTGEEDIAVIVNELPGTISITGDAAPACNASGIVYDVIGGTAGSSFAWTVPSGASIVSGSTGPNNTSITVDFGSQSGSITVTETTANGCQGTQATRQISLAGCGLQANFEADVLEVCVGETVTFTDQSSFSVAIDSWAWDFGDGANPSTANTQGPHAVTYSTSGLKEVTLTVTEGAATSVETKTAYIQVNELPNTSVITAGATEICEQTTGVPFSVTNTPGSTYNWTVPTGAVIVSGQGTNSITVDFPEGAQSGDVTVVETTAGGCTSTSTGEQSIAVTINQAPDLSTITASATEICEQTTGVTFSVTNTAGSTYNWTVPTGAVIVSGQGTNSITVDFPDGAQSGDVTVVETTAGGCTSTSTGEESIAVTVNQAPDLSTITASATEICEQTTGVTFSVTNTAGSTYNWTVPTGAVIVSGQGTNSITVDFPEGAQSGDVTVVETTAGGCTSTSTGEESIAVTVNQAPDLSTITASATEICEETTGVTFSVTNTVGSTYNWTVPTGAVIVSGQGTNSITVDFPDGAQSGDVTVTETTAAGCTSTSTGFQSIAVTVNEAPNTSVITAGETEVCEGTNGVIYSVTNTVGSTYNWVVPTGVVITSGQGSNTITVNFPVGAQSGDITVSETTAGGCSLASTDQSVTVTVNTLPGTISISGDFTPPCSATGVAYTVNGATAGSTFAWQAYTGATITSGTVGPDNTAITIDYTTVNGTISVQETSADGCVGDRVSESITLLSCGLTASIDAGPYFVCVGDSIEISSTSTGTTASTTYSWDFGGGPAGAGVSPQSSDEEGPHWVTFDEVGTVTVSLTIEENGVTDNTSVNIEVYDLPSPQIQGSDIVCENADSTYSVMNPAAFSTYDWFIDGNGRFPGDLMTTQGTSVDVEFANGDTTWLYVQESDPTTGCVGVSDSLVIVTDTLKSVPGSDITLADLQEIDLVGDESVTGIGMVFPFDRFQPIEWSSSVDDGEISNTTVLNTKARPTESPTYYRLAVTNPVTGCVDVDSIVVDIAYELIIPTGFSPNNDGQNDTWEIWNIDRFPDNEVEIYNRWGSLVWKGSNYTNEDGWRGQNMKGGELPIGTYFFVVTINNDPRYEEPYSGPVTIIK